VTDLALSERRVAAASAATPSATPASEAPTVPRPSSASAASTTSERLRTGVPDARTGGLRARSRSVERLLGVLLLFGLWELAAQVGWLQPEVLAGPSTVLTVGADLWTDGTLPAALQASVTRVAWGLGIGVTVGTLLALVAGSSRFGDDLVDANVQMLRFVPIIALQPLLIVWLGVGETVKIAMIVVGVAFPIYVNTVSAIKAIDPRHRELATVLGLSRRAVIRRVVLPGALAGFLIGLRMATAIAWLLLVFAETINATSGIGYLVSRAQILGQTDVIVVGIVLYATLGLIADGVVRTAEARLLRWRTGR
jgi:sulfonate transport system permease protein